MKYHCGHNGCDICGARECSESRPNLLLFGQYDVCAPCVRAAIKFAVNAAETFGGTFIDPAKICGAHKKN